MAISSPGLGSNLDVNSIISQLMSLEQRPLTALARKEAVFQGKISALGSLKGALSALQTAASALVPATGSSALEKFSVFKSTVADTAIASATTTSSAVAGTYSLEVTQLAQEHRVATATGIASPFDANSQLLGGGGTLTISLDTDGGVSPNKTTNVTIADGATPEAIRDAINTASAGVSATVINGVDGKQLVLVGDKPGNDQFIKLAGVAGLSYDGVGGDADEFAQLQAAQGSTFKLNGIAVAASSNTVSTAIDGITLTLTKQSAAGVSTTLTVARDTSSLTAGVNAFVKAYNDLNKTTTDLGSYNATTKQAGALNGDSTLRSVHGTVRSLVGNIPSEVAGATLQRLSDIGVSLQKDGSLAVDSSKLTKAISDNLAGVANLVAAYGSIFKGATDALVGTNGSLAARTEGLNASIKGLGKQSEAISSRLAQIEARYRKQFTALDTAISGMTKTSNFLAQQLANLPTYNNN